MTETTTPITKEFLLKNLKNIQEEKKILEDILKSNKYIKKELATFLDEKIKVFLNEKENKFLEEEHYINIASSREDAEEKFTRNYKTQETLSKYDESIKLDENWTPCYDENTLDLIAIFKGLQGEEYKEIIKEYDNRMYDIASDTITTRGHYHDLMKYHHQCTLENIENLATSENYTLDDEDKKIINDIEELFTESREITYQIYSNKRDFINNIKREKREDKYIYILNVTPRLYFNINSQETTQPILDEDIETFTYATRPTTRIVPLDKGFKEINKYSLIKHIEDSLRLEKRGVKQEITSTLVIYSENGLTPKHFEIMKQLYSYRKEGVSEVPLDDLIRDTSTTESGKGKYIGAPLRKKYVDMIEELKNSKGVNTTKEVGNIEDEIINIDTGLITTDWKIKSINGTKSLIIKIMDKVDPKTQEVVSFPMMRTLEETQQFSTIEIKQAKAITQDKGTGVATQINELLNMRILHCKEQMRHLPKDEKKKQVKINQLKKITYTSIYDEVGITLKQSDLIGLPYEEIRKKKKLNSQKQRRALDIVRKELKNKENEALLTDWKEDKVQKFFWIDTD